MLEGGTSKPRERSGALRLRPVCLLQIGERAPCAKIENSGITDDRPRQQKQTQVLEAYSLSEQRNRNDSDSERQYLAKPAKQLQNVRG